MLNNIVIGTTLQLTNIVNCNPYRYVFSIGRALLYCIDNDDDNNNGISNDYNWKMSLTVRKTTGTNSDRVGFK